MENKKPKEATKEEWNYSKEKLLYALEDKYVSKYHTPLVKTEGSLGTVAEYTSVQSLDPSAKISKWKGEAVGNQQSTTKDYYSEKCKSQEEKSQALCSPGNAYFSKMVKRDGLSACGTSSERDSNLDPGDHEDRTSSLLPLQDGEATTGEYATNLAESVLQDAFIRLSKSQPALPQEPAVSVSVGSALLPSGSSTKDIVVPQSWTQGKLDVCLKVYDSETFCITLMTHYLILFRFHDNCLVRYYFPHF